MNIRRRAQLMCAFAVVLAGAINANALRNPFIYDDYRLIVENRAMAGHMSLGVLLGLDATRPVATMSYAADRLVWGSGPFGFHLTNLVLHMLVVGLFALLVWRLADDLRNSSAQSASSVRPEIAAPVAAMLMAVHPSVAVAVGYISARPEAICAVFVLLALLSARRWMLDHGGIWLGAAVLCWLIALGAKETALMFPFLALAYDRWLLPDAPLSRRHRLLFLHGPLISLAVVLGVMRLMVFIVLEHAGVLAIQWPLALVELDVTRRYFAMLLVPAGQSIFHAIAPIDSWLQPRAIGGLALITFVGWLIWWQRRTRPLISFGLLWFVLFLVPSAALVVLDRGEPMADHRVYLAASGVLLVVGVAIERLWNRMADAQPATRAVLAAGFVALVLALSGRTVLHHATWRNPIIVWLNAAERAPKDWLPARVLGEELHRANRHGEAIATFKRSLQLGPDQSSTYGPLGVCLTETGDLNSAEAAFATLRRFQPQSAEASNGLATVALLRGSVEAAQRGYLETLQFDQSNVPARRGLVVIAEGPGANPADALRWCRDIKRLEPESPDVDACIRRNEAKTNGR